MYNLSFQNDGLPQAQTHHCYRRPGRRRESTIASRLARKLGYVNLESGAMYRALALKAVEWDTSFEDEPALVKLATTRVLSLSPPWAGNRVLLDGKDVASAFAKRTLPKVLHEFQCTPRSASGWSAHQRAMGTSRRHSHGRTRHRHQVFPDADVKVFLDADPVVREQRRLEQLRAKGIPAQSSAADVRERDHRDRTRATSPLVAAHDAVVLDSTSMSEDEVLQQVEDLVAKKLL